MTGHVVSFEPAGAPTRAVCSCGWVTALGSASTTSVLAATAANHAWLTAPDSQIEFAGLPPVERAS